MTPNLALLTPEHFCQEPEWEGTTNLFHVILHDESVSEEAATGLFLRKQFDFGLSLLPPFFPPRWTGKAERGPLVSVQADKATIQPCRFPSGGSQRTTLNSLTRVQEGVDAASFILRVDKNAAGPVSMVVRILWHGLILAEVNATVQTSHHGGRESARHWGATFAKIFASYSRRDIEVVKLFNAVTSALAIADLRWDLKFLRPGDDWEEGIGREILEADSFQLFWSPAASESSNVKKEWMFALQSREKGFIKPIYWREPVPSPPPELGHIHFGRVELSSWSAMAASSGS
ncbi:MAG TPA: toll/interleukin-1 receptor domain-containing protein [Thermoanaerobaculia bacterium]